MVGATVPCKEARGREAAVGHTKAAVTIKGGCGAAALEEEADDTGIGDDKVAIGGRRRPTTPATTAEVANVDNNEAMSGGRHRPPHKGVGRRGGLLPHKGGRDHLGRT